MLWSNHQKHFRTFGKSKYFKLSAFKSSHRSNQTVYFYFFVLVSYYSFCPSAHICLSTCMWETELEVQIILSACPCPCSPVLIPLSSLLLYFFPFLLLFSLFLHLISHFSVLDRFCLYHKHHLICLEIHCTQLGSPNWFIQCNYSILNRLINDKPGPRASN